VKTSSVEPYSIYDGKYCPKNNIPIIKINLYLCGADKINHCK
jgi:hypothetical protein